MKTYFSLKSGLISSLFLLLLFTSCQSDDISEATVIAEDPAIIEEGEESDPTFRVNNSLIFPTTAHTFGKSLEAWAIEAGTYIFTLDCESLFVNQMLNVSPNVIAPLSFSLGISTDEYTISKEQHILLSPGFILYDYPCPPEFNLEPTDGQTIEELLRENAKEIMDGLVNIEVFIDGNKVEEPMNYRLSTDMFYFTGNTDLIECFDPCITGEPQPGLIDGYFMMLKKFKVGKHHIQIKGEFPLEDLDFDWNLVLNVVK